MPLYILQSALTLRRTRELGMRERHYSQLVYDSEIQDTRLGNISKYQHDNITPERKMVKIPAV